MRPRDLIDLRPDVPDALRAGQPVVALESSVIVQGLPWPVNLETARETEAVIRTEGALPATIAVRHGRPIIGLTAAEIEDLARRRDARKASRRGLASAIVEQA